MHRSNLSQFLKKNSALMLAVLFGVTLAISFMSSQASTQTSQKAPASRTSQTAKSPAAKELQIIDLDGYRKLVADHRGKPLLITFWATWCEPCRDEFPLVNELAKQYAPQGLVVIGVNKDDDAELNLVQRFIARNQPVFPSVRQKPRHEDEFNDGVDPRWRGVMPANFFYTADGQLAGFVVGGQPREVFEQKIRAILPSNH